MKPIISFIVLLFWSFIACAQASALHLGERHTFESSILKEARTYEVYLPKGYSSTAGNTFPVLYVMDGDYNFQFITGIVEMLVESGKITDLIVVGISDLGTWKYRNYCRPTVEGAGSGDADLFMDFVQNELKVQVANQYRTSGYSMITGHSMGGLFTANYWLTRPNDFDDYIAIDPSFWWNQNEIISRADSILAMRKELSADIYLSLASTKGMGVLSFVGVLDKYHSNQKNWHFNHYKNDNHGSVAMPSIKFALENIFEDWVMTEEKYRRFENIDALLSSYIDLKEAFSTEFTLPANLLGNAIYYEYQKPGAIDTMEAIITNAFPASITEFYVQKAMIMMEYGETDAAIELLRKYLKTDASNYKIEDTLCQLYMAKKEWKTAKYYAQAALQKAKKIGLRRWMISQIEGHLLEATLEQK